MKKYYLPCFIFSFSFLLISCDGGPTSNIGPTPTPTDTTAADKFNNGKIYYDTNCGGCHSVGTYDTDSAFLSSDLKALISRGALDAIKPDMSETVQYGGTHNFMGRFNKVSSVRIDQLRAFISQSN